MRIFLFARPRLAAFSCVALVGVLLALASAPIWADDQLDRMMQEMENKKSRAALIGEAVRQGMAAVQRQVERWLPNVQDTSELDAAEFDDVLDRTSDVEPSVNSQFWQQAEEDVNAAKDLFDKFPFRHPWWAPSIVGDYLEKGLFPAMDRVMSDE